ncbi:MAG: BrnT family toxin [Acidobacteria bacterium]|nr:BrnT family toxin [Acidobacteriota bacterium]
MRISELEFEWDPAKARSNYAKHGVQFNRALEVFRDPLALTIPDEEHSAEEQRWITLGKDRRGQYIVVVHTYRQTDSNSVRIRLISARKPTMTEIWSYEEQ